MSIVSFNFIFLSAIITVLYFVVPKKWQWVAILIGNIVFYSSASVKCLALVVVLCLVSYVAALRLEEASGLTALMASATDAATKKEIRKSVLVLKRYICAVAVVCVGGVWVVLKYSNFFISNYNALVGKISEQWLISPVSWILPLGISFYTFHIIGYVVDVFRGKYPAERNFLKYFTFVLYFPHIVQGPFSRFDSLGKSIFEGHSFSYDRLCEGCARILWGVFKKLVIADKLGVSVNLIFDNYKDYPGVSILFAIFLYCIQLYADFSGYMDIVCGLSRVWGIDLAENFKRPYFAKTIDEFWRRWHITLGKWFKDYVFYPVSMGKTGQNLGRFARKKWGARMGKLVPGYFALIFVWTATGLWHGASWNYLIWGYLNLLVILSTMQLSEFYDRLKQKLHINSESAAWKLFCIVRTFILVCFFRFFSIQSSLAISLSTLKHLAAHFLDGGFPTLEGIFAGIARKDMLAILIGTLVLLLVDILQENEVWSLVKKKCPIYLRMVFYALLIMMLLLFAGGNTDLTGGFMYANF